ncbi:MAG: cell envelope biogenesis protein TolA [Hyphomicrobiales bacterium]|nr:cell envelope biogenesis protein TolA [Hyphomicrobiales bacterium]
MQVSRKEPGFVVSALAHASLLALTLVAFSRTEKFDDAQEAVPVEIVTDQAFSQIAKGEKSAKEAKPVQRAEKIAEIHETKEPPLAEAKKDVPPPLPPLRPQIDPGHDDEPKKPEPQRMAAAPPPPPRPEPVKPAPEPPKPEPVKHEPPKPVAKPAKAEPEEKPEADDAEPVKPPVRPKEAKKEEPKKEEPKPKEEAKKPEPKKPEPPSRPHPTRQEVQKDSKKLTDEVAKLLAQSKAEDKAKTDKPASKPKSGDETSTTKSKFDSSAISKLLDHDKPQATGSTGREVVRTAALGAQRAHATKMSPSMIDQLNSLMIDQYKKCWTYFGSGSARNYVPVIRVRYRTDGSLAQPPVLVNPPSDPAFATKGEAALRAIKECDPLRIPAQFSPYYDEWKALAFKFDPDE